MKRPKPKKLSRRAFEQICVYTQVCFVRNIAGEKFPNALSPEERLRLGARLSAVLCEHFGFRDVTRDPALRGTVADCLNLLPEGDRDEGYHLLQLNSDFHCEVMATNHLTFTSRTTEQDLLPVAATAEALLAEIGRILPFATHERYGFLTAQLPLVGSGFRVRSILHLPGLSHFNHLRELCNAADFNGVLVELDSPDPPPGHLITLFNRFSLGRSVREILSGYSRTLDEVIRQELHARQRLLFDEPYILLDLLSRSRGLLNSTLLLPESEALDALSNIRLGASLGILKPASAANPFSRMWFIWPTAGFLANTLERHSDLLETLPPQVADFQPWRLEAVRARLMTRYTGFKLKDSFVERALTQ